MPTVLPGQGSMRARLRKPVYDILSDDMMMVLAILLIPSTVLPFFVTFSPLMLLTFEYLNYAIIIAFTIEYLLKLYVAESRKAYVLDVWHLLDLAIIILAVADFLPVTLPDGSRIAPVFRLLRIPRAFIVAGRTVKRVNRVKAVAADGGSKGPLKVCTLDSAEATKCQDNIGAAADNKSHKWIDIQGISKADMGPVSAAFHVPEYEIENKVMTESYPRIDHFDGYTTIFLQDYRLVSEEDGPVEIMKGGMLVVCAGDFIVTATTGYNGVFDSSTQRGLDLKGEEIPVRALYTILKKIIEDYDRIIDRMEYTLAELEERPVGTSGKEFLEETFRLKKEINKVYHSLKHLKRVLGVIVEKKVALKGMDKDAVIHFKALYDEANYLFEASENIRDGLISLIELHINTVSYDMNRFMRLLATITCLALVPSIIGGLLGENLYDSPYAISLWEIALVVFTVMTLALYLFWKKGWLK